MRKETDEACSFFEESDLPTLPMTPNAQFGYDPEVSIRSGEKRHTLRSRCYHGDREITIRGRRTGLVVRMTGHRQMTREEFLTDEFARSDGLPDAAALESLLRRFSRRGNIDDTMWLNEFEMIADGD